MRIYRDDFKGQNAVLLENNFLKVVILPGIGGKIASVYEKNKDFELLFQNKEDTYKVPKLYDSFEKFDAAGFDDAFPTIDKCEIKQEDKTVVYPDHGEIWTASFEESIENNRVILKYFSEILPYKYVKIIELKEHEIEVNYHIENLGDEQFPYIWAAHYLVNCHKDMQLIMPSNVEEVVNVQNSNKLGAIESIHNYPITKTLSGEEYDLSKVLEKDANHTEKFYTKLNVNEGLCGIYYPHKDVTYKLKYNKEVLPYIGFWVTEGGFRGDYNCALEPCNGYYDSILIAERHKKLEYLQAKSKIEFCIKIELK